MGQLSNGQTGQPIQALISKLYIIKVFFLKITPPTSYKTSGKGYKYVTVCDKVAHWYAGLYRRESARPITTWKTRQTLSIICLL